MVFHLEGAIEPRHDLGGPRKIKIAHGSGAEEFQRRYGEQRRAKSVAGHIEHIKGKLISMNTPIAQAVSAQLDGRQELPVDVDRTGQRRW